VLLALTAAGLLLATASSSGSQPVAPLESWLRRGLHEGDPCSEAGTFEMGHGMQFRTLSVIVSTSTTRGSTSPLRKCRFQIPDARSRSGKPARRFVKATTSQPGEFLVTVHHMWDEHLSCVEGNLVIRRSLSEARFLVTSKNCDQRLIAASAEAPQVNVELQCREK